MFYARNIYETLEGSTKLGIRLKLWDTPGEEIMRPLVDVWIKSADVVFILFSLSDQTRHSFTCAQEYVNLVKKSMKGDNVTIILVGSKLDELEASDSLQQVISHQEIQSYITAQNIGYHETSSLSGQGVEELFNTVVTFVKDEIIRQEQIPPPKWIPDKQCRSCSNCESSWTVTNRRHHCRRCGNLFCSKCASKFIPIPRIGKLTPTRVCDSCFDIILGDT